MSRRRKRNSIPQIILIMIILALLAGAGYFAYQKFFIKTEEGTTTETQKTEETEEESKTEEKTPEKSETITETTKTKTTKNTEGIKEIEEDNPNNSETVTGHISKAAFNGDNYRIVATTDQALSEGTCKLTFKKDGQTIEKTAEIVARPNASSCSFDISGEQVSAGFWTIEVKIETTENRQGTINDQVEVVK